MGQSSHNSAQHDHGHSQEHHAPSPHPFTDHELYLIEMANTHAQFEGHHHHHHHGHVEYRRPHNIDTSLGLFALKKLNAINPEFLLQKEKRLLQPVAPGVITHLAYGGLMLATGWYAFYSWKTLGYSFVMNPKTVIGVGALVGANYAAQIVFNYGREFLWSFDRSKLVGKYKQKYGQQFLLDVLQPTFRLPQASDSN